MIAIEGIGWPGAEQGRSGTFKPGNEYTGTLTIVDFCHVTDGQTRVWKHRNTAFTPRNIVSTVPFGWGSVMVLGCVSHDCKLDLVTINGNLTG